MSSNNGCVDETVEVVYAKAVEVTTELPLLLFLILLLFSFAVFSDVKTVMELEGYTNLEMFVKKSGEAVG